MIEPETTKTTKNTVNKGLLCPKCEHLNPAGVDRCEYCGGHLYLACKFCGQRNERVRTRCSKCGHRLHRGLFHRWGKVWRSPRNRGQLVFLPLILLFAWVAYRIIVFIAEMGPAKF